LQHTPYNILVSCYGMQMGVSLLHLVHTSKLWPNIKVCSKSIEIYYTWYFRCWF